MGFHKIKTSCFIIILICLLAACGTENFKALNSDKSYQFSYNGFEKILKINHDLKNFSLVFFTKDCGVCKEQIPILEKLSHLYNFDIYVILGDAKNENDAKIWAHEKKLNLKMFYEKKAVNFLSRAVGEIYGVPVISFFKQGKMEQKFIGLTPFGILEEEIKRIN